MILNYFKSALRSLRKQFGYTLLNLFGLALGLAITLNIFMFVQHELSYDNYHESADNVYRLVLDASLNGRALVAPVVPAPMSKTLLADFPEVEASARLFGFGGERIIRRGNNAFLDDNIHMADSSLFDIISVDFLRGDPSTALAKPHTVVLTQSLATKLFGKEDPFGQTVTMGDSTQIEVTGIIADLPTNSHLQFSALQTLLDNGQASNDQWVSNNFVNYVRLQAGHDPNLLIAKFPEMFETYAGPQIAQAFGMSYQEFLAGGNNFGYKMQPVKDVHLKSNFEIDIQEPGNMNYVIMFSAIALFILILACINFMNLATARGATRAREVAIRKTVGSERSQLIAQFMSEAALLTLVAFLLSFILVWISLPLFNTLSGQTLTMSGLMTPSIGMGLFLGFILVSLLAGLYPAFYLSRFEPIEVLKTETLSGSTKSKLRNGLVVFQFTISIVLLIGTLVVRNQLDFIQNKRLGFDKEHVVVLERAFSLRRQVDSFKSKLKSDPNIVAVGGSTSLPGEIHGGSGYVPEGSSPDEALIFSPIYVDTDFVEAMGITMASGRDFSAEYPSDSTAVFLNQAAVRKIGWTDPIGRMLGEFGDQTDENGNMILDQHEVVGVIEDYHFQSLRSEIGGAVYLFANFTPNNLVIRVTGNDMQETLAFIEETWNDFLPGTPVTISFLNESYGQLFESDQRLANVFTAFASFAILIACMGLFGLAFFMTEQRTKEIGIRKALGASFVEIIVLLSKDFSKLVIISLVLAIPIAYFAMNEWLNGFVYRSSIGVWVFVLAGVVALLIAWLTVSYQSVRAARQNPIKALRRG